MENCTVCPFVKYWYVIVALLVVAWAVYKFAQSRNAPPPQDIPGVMNLTEANFAEAIASGVTLVGFWAPWCGPCRMQFPVIAETVALLPEGVSIAKVNVDEAAGLTKQFGIQSIPAWIVFRDGREIHRADGLQTRETLLKLAEMR